MEREDAPLGVGSLQLFVDADFEQHYFTLYEDERHHPQLRRMAVFDIVCNNTDRKSGHCLLDPADDHVWGIDNGLSFHAEFKLRTVIWEFAGEPLPDERRWPTSSGSSTTASPTTWPSCSAPSSATPCSPGPGRCCAPGELPTDPSGRRYPWPLV